MGKEGMTLEGLAEEDPFLRELRKRNAASLARAYGIVNLYGSLLRDAISDKCFALSEQSKTREELDREAIEQYRKAHENLGKPGAVVITPTVSDCTPRVVNHPGSPRILIPGADGKLYESPFFGEYRDC